MEKNFRRVFEPAMAKQPPPPDQIAHQAAHDPGTHRAFFLHPRPTAGQHIGLAIVLGDELDLDFARDRLPVALQQPALVSFELRARRAHQITGPALPQPLEILFAHNSAVKDPHPPSTAVFALHGLKHAGRNALPDHLPRHEEIIAVEGEERLCVCCGEERCRIGYEEKEVLDMEPARYFVRVIKREKLACRKCTEGGVVTAAAGGPKIVEKGKLSDAVVIDVLIKKYLSHLPLYRQASDLHRDYEIELSRSTLNAAALTAGELLLPVAAVSRPGGPVVFDFCMSRAREGPAEFLRDYGGIL
jgi:transposase